VGVHAVVNTPIDAIPDLSENQVIVFTDWMGRSPREIEDQVTYPLSVNLQGLAGVKSVRSSSEFNFSMINIIFEDNVDFYFARQRVAERLALSNTFLPQGVTPYLAPDATGAGANFLVYGRRGRTRSGPTEGPARLDRPLPAQFRARRCAGRFRRRIPDRISNRRRSVETASVRRHAGGHVFRRRAIEFLGRGRVIHQGNAEYLVSRSRVDHLETRHRAHPDQGRRGDRHADHDRQFGDRQPGDAFRRSVLEKNGAEAVGGVVMMRQGKTRSMSRSESSKRSSSFSQGCPTACGSCRSTIGRG